MFSCCSGLASRNFNRTLMMKRLKVCTIIIANQSVWVLIYVKDLFLRYLAKSSTGYKQKVRETDVRRQKRHQAIKFLMIDVVFSDAIGSIYLANIFLMPCVPAVLALNDYMSQSAWRRPTIQDGRDIFFSLRNDPRISVAVVVG